MKPLNLTANVCDIRTGAIRQISGSWLSVESARMELELDGYIVIAIWQGGVICGSR